ncbi:MAG: CDP-alcohol phosphatidyltransferase family protein [Pseudomonadota bacterium]
MSNRALIHPLSARVVTLALRMGLSPNQLSLLGLTCGLVAALAYYRLPEPAYVMAGLGLMLGWHVLDGADGRLARLTGSASPLGRLIDGLCDHVVFLGVYVALAFSLVAAGWGFEVWPLALGAGLSHLLQAASYEERRQKYQRRVKGQARLNMAQTGMAARSIAAQLARLYDLGQRVAAGGNPGFDALLASLAAGKTMQSHALRESLLRKYALIVRLWSALNSNNRSFAIALFAVIARPDLYFWYELIVLNVLFLMLCLGEALFEQRAQRVMTVV